MRIGPTAHVCAAQPNDAARARWPDFPAAALPASGRVGTGCGLDAEASRRGALGEAVELMHSCAWGDERTLVACARDLGDAAVAPERLNGFSAAQIENRERVNLGLAGLDWVPPRVAPETPLHWLEACDAHTGARAFVPADAVLIGRRAAGDPGAACVADSTGCACGPTPEAARLAALFELVERDAAARWWFGRRRRPVLPLAILAGHGGIVAHLTDRARQTRLFDITSDIAVPVVAAASWEPDGTAVALGFAARGERTVAALAAVTEMLGIETALPPWRDVAEDPEAQAWIRDARADRPPLSEVSQATADAPTLPAIVPEALHAGLAAVARRGAQVLFVDLGRVDTGAPVFRGLSPDLCPLKPRLGKARLFAPDPRDLAPIGPPAPDDLAPRPPY